MNGNASARLVRAFILLLSRKGYKVDAYMKKMSRHALFIISVLALQISFYAQPVRVGYTNCLETANYSQSVMNEIGQLKWYFAHASVGGNMVDGIADLHAMNAGFYPIFQQQSWSSWRA